MKYLLVAIAVFIGINIAFVLFVFISALFARRQPVDRIKPFYRRLVPFVARYACFWSGIKPELTGEEKLPDSRFVFISNHRSGFDPLSAIWLFRKYGLAFISKPSNIDIPLIGNLAYEYACLPIDRDSDRNALKTILRASDYIKKDICSVGIYPEGTRNKTPGTLLPFHAGSFKIAQKAKVPVVLAYTKEGKITILETVPAEKVLSMTTRELSEYSRGVILCQEH